jgi:GntR family transcriptional regulator, carbon starvation induced regulator
MMDMPKRRQSSPTNQQLADQGSPDTTATRVYKLVRDAILIGELAPGQKLGIDFVSQRFGVGATPIREALNRLSSEGLVLCRDLRGFHVVDFDDREITELFLTRAKVFALIIREAIVRGDNDWEERVIIAFHRLSKTPWSIEQDEFRLNPRFATSLHDFYAALFSGSGSRWLVDFGLRLLHEGDRFFWLVMKSKYEANVPRRVHASLVDAVVARDAEEAVRLITELQERLGETIINTRNNTRKKASATRSMVPRRRGGAAPA